MRPVRVCPDGFDPALDNAFGIIPPRDTTLFAIDKSTSASASAEALRRAFKGWFGEWDSNLVIERVVMKPPYDVWAVKF